MNDMHEWNLINQTTTIFFKKNGYNDQNTK